MAFGFNIASQGKNMLNRGRDYVYYDRLKKDGEENKALYNQVKNLLNLSNFDQNPADPKNIANYFQRLAHRERDKERRMFEIIFGIRTKWDGDTGGDAKYLGQEGKHIIWALNLVFNTKNVFKRFLSVITKTNSKSAFNRFGWYFNRAMVRLWNGEAPEKSQAVLDKFVNWVKSNSNSSVDMQKVWMNYVRPIYEQAFNMAWKDITWSKFEDGKKKNLSREQRRLQEAYAELDEIIQVGKNDPLFSSFLKKFGLTTSFKKLFVNKENTMPTAQQVYDLINQLKVTEDASTAGRFMENVTQKIEENAAKQFTKQASKNKNIEVSTKSAGGTAQKIDSVVLIGEKRFIEMGNVLLSQYDTSHSLGETAEIASDLSKKMAELNKLGKMGEGFIIYQNEKSYTMSTIKKFGGYSAGEARTLDDIENDFAKLNLRFKHFLFFAFQLIKGTVGTPQEGSALVSKDDVSALYARAISAMLFDDYKTIGQDSKNDQAIHVLVLNDLYIPLSVFFQLLANAFREATNIKGVESVLKVDLKVPKEIYYERKPKGGWTWDHWEKQREEARTQSTVQYHFLRDFKKIITELDLWRGGKGPVLKEF